MIRINSSPVLTAKNYGVNDIEIDENILFEDLTNLKRTKINHRKTSAFNKFTQNKIATNTCNIHNETETNCVKISKNIKKNNEFLEKNGLFVQKKPNCCLNAEFSKNSIKPLVIEFYGIDSSLFDNVSITVNENISAKLIIKFYGNQAYSNTQFLKFNCDKNAKIDCTILSYAKSSNINLLNIETDLCENSSMTLNIFDFSGNTNVENVKSNLNGKNAKMLLNSVLLAKKNSNNSLNYHFDVFGEKCFANMDVLTILSDESRKNFVGTISFERGAKKGVGEEDELCMMLSKNAKGNSTPILLSKEEDVDGKHSSSIGQIDDKILFYAMTRGLDKTEATKLILKAKLNKYLNYITDNALKNQIENILNVEIENNNGEIDEEF